MRVVQTKDPQTVEREGIFSGKYNLNYRYIRQQPMNMKQLLQNHLLSAFSI